MSRRGLDPTETIQDCFACRVIGSGALGITGVYALRQSMPKAPGSLWGKRIVACTGIALIAAAAYRWVNPHPPKLDLYQ